MKRSERNFKEEQSNNFEDRFEKKAEDLVNEITYALEESKEQAEDFSEDVKKGVSFVTNKQTYSKKSGRRGKSSKTGKTKPLLEEDQGYEIKDMELQNLNPIELEKR